MTDVVGADYISKMKENSALESTLKSMVEKRVSDALGDRPHISVAVSSRYVMAGTKNGNAESVIATATRIGDTSTMADILADFLIQKLGGVGFSVEVQPPQN